MPTITIEYRDDSERLLLEQAIAYLAQVRQAADDAPAGSVLAVAEQVALDGGRKLLRSSLASVLQRRADSADSQKKRKARAPRGSASGG